MTSGAATAAAKGGARRLLASGPPPKYRNEREYLGDVTNWLLRANAMLDALFVSVLEDGPAGELAGRPQAEAAGRLLGVQGGGDPVRAIKGAVEELVVLLNEGAYMRYSVDTLAISLFFQRILSVHHSTPPSHRVPGGVAAVLRDNLVRIHATTFSLLTVVIRRLDAIGFTIGLADVLRAFLCNYHVPLGERECRAAASLVGSIFSLLEILADANVILGGIERSVIDLALALFDASGEMQARTPMPGRNPFDRSLAAAASGATLKVAAAAPPPGKRPKALPSQAAGQAEASLDYHAAGDGDGLKGGRATLRIHEEAINHALGWIARVMGDGSFQDRIPDATRSRLVEALFSMFYNGSGRRTSLALIVEAAASTILHRQPNVVVSELSALIGCVRYGLQCSGDLQRSCQGIARLIDFVIKPRRTFSCANEAGTVQMSNVVHAVPIASEPLGAYDGPALPFKVLPSHSSATPAAALSVRRDAPIWAASEKEEEEERAEALPAVQAPAQAAPSSASPFRSRPGEAALARPAQPSSVHAQSRASEEAAEEAFAFAPSSDDDLLPEFIDEGPDGA